MIHTNFTNVTSLTKFSLKKGNNNNHHHHHHHRRRHQQNPENYNVWKSQYTDLKEIKYYHGSNFFLCNELASEVGPSYSKKRLIVIIIIIIKIINILLTKFLEKQT